MMPLCCDVLNTLKGKTLATAESLTGGGIGSAITTVPGSSEVYKGGIVAYTNWVKHHILGVDTLLLETFGAVSAPVAEAMAYGVRQLLKSDVAVSVTGLAGPGGDEYGNPVGTVFIGYSDDKTCYSRKYLFAGSREDIRTQTIKAALSMIIEFNQ